MIGGLISPISGKLYLSKTDCVVAGANPLALTRAYLAPHMPYRFRKSHAANNFYRWHYLQRNYEGWKFFPHTKLVYDDYQHHVHLNTSSGASYTFLIANEKTTLLQAYAISNCGMGAFPSGQLDMRNTTISRIDNQIVVQNPCGSTYFYTQCTKRLYLLEKEKLPNGKYVRYVYDNRKQLSRIESLDATQTHLYATLEISGFLENKKRQITSSRGQTNSYFFKNRITKGEFREKKRTTNYKISTPLVLQKREWNQVEEEKIDYTRSASLLDTFFDKKIYFKVEHAGFGRNTDCHYRINKLLFPVGKDETFQPVYEIDYQPAIAGVAPGVTQVKNCNGTTTTYHISKALLIDRIEYPNKEELFTWSPNQWLAKATVLDKQGNILLEKEYQYDAFGNPILESILGGYSIKREFSQDGRNLLVREENTEGLVTEWRYLPETNLVLEKITGSIRECFEYDASHNLVRKSLEERGGQKKIVEIKLYQSGASLHMPEWIENKYLEEGQEKLLKRTHLNYNQYGNIAEEAIYDANGTYQYTIVREWDDQGNLLSKTNALGQKESFIYDTRGHCIEENGIAQTIKREFDLQGRMTKQSTLATDSAERIESFTYDTNDNLIGLVDVHGNEFSYKYDPATQQVVETMGPDAVITRASYDSFGNKISETNANGKITRYEYNIYGDPTRIIYPNNSIASFCYDKAGKLIRKTDREGHKTDLSYDLLGRIISKRYETCEESFVYNSFNLVKQIDYEGHKTTFVYDGAGRKISESKAGKTKRFEYDPLGRLSATYEDRLGRHYEYNFLDSIVIEFEEEEGSPLLRIGYRYDEAGNVVAIERWIDGNQIEESYQYDGLGREISYIDGCSNKTTTHYDDDLLQKTTIDPKGVVTIETMDAYDRVVQRDIKDSHNNLISSCKKQYDGCGNLVDWEQGSRVHFEYTSDNKVKCIERGAGTSECKTTKYTYTPGGKVATKILPDGTVLSYGYDELGYLSTIDSSDRSIKHRFTHNKLGKLLFAADAVDSSWVAREVDAFGNVLVERFFNGIEIHKTYDVHDRPLKLAIANVGSVQYEYDSIFLREVSRFSAGGQRQYSHKYTKYDLSGNPLTEEMGFGCGTITNRYDGMGRKYAIASPYFSQNSTFDGCGNLISNEVNEETSTYTYDALGQIASEDETLYQHDELYNRLGQSEINALNEYTYVAYDGNGNQVQNGEAQYEFDPLNRLKVATINGQTIRFLYDPLGRRLSKIVEGESREDYMYDGLHEIGALDEKGQVKSFRVLASIDETRPATLAIELDGTPHLVINDAQNNVAVLVDPDGVVA